MKKKPSIELLEKAVNSYLSLDPEMTDKISTFKGKVIAVELLGLNRSLYLLPQGVLRAESSEINEETLRESRPDELLMRVVEHYDGKVDTVLSGMPLALFKMGLATNVAPMLLKGEIEIKGDVRLGREFKKMLGNMDIDWEEHLANLVGDVAANQAMRIARKVSSWAGQAKDSLTIDLSEYLQEESRDVVSGAELEVFYKNVDSLREDVDRLSARVEALKV